MATTVNSRFLAITAKQPNINTGWQIRVLDYKDMKTLVAILPEFVSFTFTQQISDPGTGSITVDTDSPWWNENLNNGWSNNALREREYVFEAWENGLRRFAWLGTTVTNQLAGEDETLVTTISGPGIARVLTWASIMRPGWPKKPPILKYTEIQVSESGVGTTTKKIPVYRDVSSSDKLPAFLWRFDAKWTTMRMWYTVLRAAQRRGVIPQVTPLFDALKDSNKQPWVFVRTLEAITDNHGYQPETPGENLLDFLNDCTGQDYSKWFGQRLEWMMYPGFRLDVRRKIGVDRSKQVRFWTGQLISNERTRDREKIYNRIVAVDVDGAESTSTSKASVNTFNLREQRNDTNKNIVDKDRRSELSQRYLDQSKDQKSEYAIQIPYDAPGRIPYHNFFVGDYITVSDSGRDYTDILLDKYRVMAITISMTAESTIPDVELSLQSIIDSKMQEIEKRITQLVNDPRTFSLDDLKNIDIPEKPSTKSTLVYNPETGKWEAQEVTDSDETDTSTYPRVFIQLDDPAGLATNAVRQGDFWLKSS